MEKSRKNRLRNRWHFKRASSSPTTDLRSSPTCLRRGGKVIRRRTIKVKFRLLELQISALTHARKTAASEILFRLTVGTPCANRALCGVAARTRSHANRLRRLSRCRRSGDSLPFGQIAAKYSELIRPCSPSRHRSQHRRVQRRDCAVLA